MKSNKTKQIFLTLIAVLSLVLITVGVSYSLFTYSKTGVTDNIVKTGKINFLYTEVSGIGKGISLTDAFPISDEEGKLQTGEGKVFDFKITSTIEMNSSISYEVTVRKKNDSTLDEDKVKLYLTEVDGIEKELILDKYSNLTQTNTKVPDGVIEKTIYEGTVPANTSNYEKNFRLRMWLDNDTDFSDGDMNNKTFTVTVNVYANGKVVDVPTMKTLTQMILDSNQVITKSPTLTTSSNNTNDESGLYISTLTNTGEPTYYFRGNVENNYVNFAGFTWRIVRINEDGTVRIIMQDGINNNATYAFNSNYNNYTYMYYSNSEVKSILENWYQTNIGSKSNLGSKVSSGNYYCEQAKTIFSSNWTSGNTGMTVYSSYTPNFKCVTDGNGKGQLNASVGLITYDEAVYAGGYAYQDNNDYYLYNNKYFWTMSPAGFSGSYANTWTVYTTGSISSPDVNYNRTLYAVLNLKTDTLATGTGTSNDPYIVE